MITFVGMSNRSSGEIRGKQISQALEAQYIDVSILGTEPHRILEHVVMVRTHRGENVVKRLQEIGCKVGYDILDTPGSDFLFYGKLPEDMSYLHGDIFDFYIVNNTATKDIVQTATNKPCFVIPHHSINFDHTRSCYGNEIKRIGYLGLIDQIDNLEELKEICREIGVELVVDNHNTIEGCTKFLKSLDAGLVFLNEDCDEKETIDFVVGGKTRTVNKKKRSENLMRFKPNTKLTNFQSFGIPTICAEYESFKEFGGENYIPIKNLDEFRLALKTLVDDVEMRKNLSDLSYQHAKSFHIYEIANLYKQIPRSVK